MISKKGTLIMQEQPLQDIIIYGTTSNGKVFRPSDWAERLCGILSSFDKANRLLYNELVRPVLIDKIRSVAIDARLEELNESMFRFLMDFAADNDLRVLNADELACEQKSQVLPENLDAKETLTEQGNPPNENNLASSDTQTSSEQDNTEQYARSVVREIPPTETSTAFAALSILRPLLTDINGFVEQVNTVQRAQGYRLLGVYEEGKNNAVAVCGFREETNLVSGRHIHIDDFVTVPQSRQRGYAKRLLNEVFRIAQEHNIRQVQIDSNVSSERKTSHRVLFEHDFEIHAYHFVKHID